MAKGWQRRRQQQQRWQWPGIPRELARDDEGQKEALETTEWAEKLGWNPELRGTPLGSGYRQLNRQAPSGV